MTCSKYPRMLSRLLDGELSPGEIAEAEGHAAQCASCLSLIESWRLQSAHLRRHLRRHALSEDFVRNVCQAAIGNARHAGYHAAARKRRRGLVRWLPLAAAILLAAVIVSQYFPGREGIGYARVIDPGERLEVLSSHSAVWVRTSAGEILHPGDWMRTPESAAAEILWHDFCHLTLEPGTLARIPDNPQPDHVILLSGSILSDVRVGEKNFRVLTPAGSVTGSFGRFSVQVRDVALTNLQAGEGGAEILSGTIVSAGEVSVGAGSVTVEVPGATSTVAAGQAAAFAGSQVTGLNPIRASVDASLRIAPQVPGGGTISSTLTRAESGLHVNLNAVHISLKKLLECATGDRVRMEEEVAVTGSLRFPVESSPESVVSAIGASLQLPVSLRHVKAQLSVAAAQQDQPPAPGRAAGIYTLEKYPDGTTSFDFQAVPAGRAFQILRSAIPDFPELASEAAWTPITSRARLLSPKEVAAHISNAMGFQIRSSEAMIRVIEVGIASSENGAPATPITEPGVRQPGGARAGSVEKNQAETPRQEDLESRSSSTLPRSEVRTSEGGSVEWWPYPVPMPTGWYVFGGGEWPSGFNRPAAPVGDPSSKLKGRVSPKTREFFGLLQPANKPAPSLHLIWPLLGVEEAAGRESAYLVTNHWALPAHALWNGYDRGGQLIVQVTIFVPAGSTASVVPLRDLPAPLGEGGHWETTSDLPLVGARDGGSGDGLLSGLPWASERLPRQWSIPALWISEYGGKLWLVNPGDQETTLVLAVMLEEQALSTEQLTIPPHGGIMWPGSSFQDNIEALGPRTRAMVVVHALQGAVAAGAAR
jgi:hypothetical protein